MQQRTKRSALNNSAWLGGWLLGWLICIGLVTTRAMGGSPCGDQPCRAWLGVPQLEDTKILNERLLAAFAARDVPPLSARTVSGNEPYKDISGQELLSSAADLVRIAEASRTDGTAYWGRIGGTPSEREAAQYVATRLRTAGLKDVRIEDVPVDEPQWWPEHWRVTLLADPVFGVDTHDLTFTSAFPGLFSAAAPADGLEAEVVYVGLGRPADIAGRELSGKIAIYRIIMQPNTFFHTGRSVAERLVRAGAVGVVGLVDGPSNLQYAMKGLEAQSAPSFVLGGADGQFLEDLLGRAGATHAPRMRLELAVRQRSSWTTQNAIAVVPGTGDQFVLVTAHLRFVFSGSG